MIKILITDANILIDLLKTGAAESFFKLEYEIYTTLAVIIECNNKQQVVLNRHIKAGRLRVNSFNTEDDEKIEILIKRYPGLSSADCSVFYTANKLKAILLTGDRKLKKTAEEEKIEVRGIFWIFDEMLKQKIIEKTTFKQKLMKLKEVNRWLPEGEFGKRI